MSDENTVNELEAIARLVVATFHNHVTLLETYWDVALLPVREVLFPSPFEIGRQPTVEELRESLQKPVARLREYLINLIDQIRPRLEDQQLVGVESLYVIPDKLAAFAEGSYATLDDLMAIRPILRRTILFMDSLLRLKLTPRELARAIRDAAKNVERLICLFHLAQAESRLLEMRMESASLRDFAMSRLTPGEEPTLVLFDRLVQKACESLGPLARSKRVEIRRTYSHLPHKVKVEEHAMQRVVNSLLSNAIKYNWSPPDEPSVWVRIDVGRHDDYVYVQFENWGDPIEPVEIENGLIFEYGYRGRRAQGQTGTGVGLWDARTVADRHNAKLTVISRPTRPVIEPHKSMPYLTTVTLEVPIFRE